MIKRRTLLLIKDRHSSLVTSPRLLRHPRHLPAPPPHAYRRRRLLHHRCLPSSRGPGRKNPCLPCRRILLARPRPPVRPLPSRPGPPATNAVTQVAGLRNPTKSTIIS